VFSSLHTAVGTAFAERLLLVWRPTQGETLPL
jgi:hypothetical protein